VENHHKWAEAAKFLGCHSIRVNAATGGAGSFEEQQKRAAGQVAVAVPGVKRVNNLILVVKGDSQAEGSPLPADSLLIARTP